MSEKNHPLPKDDAAVERRGGEVCTLILYSIQLYIIIIESLVATRMLVHMRCQNKTSVLQTSVLQKR